MSDPRRAERIARVALSRLHEPADLKIAGLVSQMGAVDLHAGLLGGDDADGLAVASRLAGIDPERELARAEQRGLRYVIPGDEEWPRQLDDLEHAGGITLGGATRPVGGIPLGLWVKGPLRLDVLARSVAVVGSRSATTYGTEVAADLAAHAAEHGLTVVSGAAYGIDYAAHRGALAGRGPTVAVLACGADRTYPQAHATLFSHLAEHGAIVSEQPPGAAPMRMRFLTRNRLIAALTQGTVVVEAAARSGALSTANWADRLSRRVMAVPGPVTSAPSVGSHQLVRTGVATLVTRGEEVLELLGTAGEGTLDEPRGPTRRRDRLPAKDQAVLEAVPVERPAPVQSIARVARAGLRETQGSLLRLQEGRFVVQTAIGEWVLGPEGRRD